ncbi:CCCH zinc finger domain-containing protein [Dioscorea alata]|uniref:CCCH zinc finger domain-containing protein n=2 Tax=Dioscorea alata TaxID=55571 RepID=A0ACB7TY61_DIOAL|nr:CCCH zinc finger domain-containing protein [Dioscorea alata]
MLGRRSYKTKPCILFQRGRCHRQNCTFAHGEAELRRAPGPPFNGRRDYKGGDLRDKLDRRHSPQGRYSPGRDRRGHHLLHSKKPLLHDRGLSLSRSPARRRMRQHSDGQSDHSESFKRSIGDDEQMKEDANSSYDKNDVLEDELRQIEDAIEKLDEDKTHLERLLEDKGDEADKLLRRIEDLERQLNKEEENCKRITSKIKKFTKVYGRYLKIQEDLKRAEVRFQRFGDQVGLDVSKPSVTEDSSLNIGSDGEANRENNINPKNVELPNHASTSKKRTRLHPPYSDEAKLGSSRKRERFSTGVSRSEKHAITEGTGLHSEHNSKETDLVKGKVTTKVIYNSVTDDSKQNRGKNSPSIYSLDKWKGSDVMHTMPPTSMAAHAVDELTEAIEIEGRPEALEANAVIQSGILDNKLTASYIPPIPLFTKNAYKQFEGDDEEVDVEKVDSEMVNENINSDVEI